MGHIANVALLGFSTGKVNANGLFSIRRSESACAKMIFNEEASIPSIHVHTMLAESRSV